MASALTKIWETPAWAALVAHASSLKPTHLRDLLKDSERCRLLTCEFDGILLDYSRQRVTQETMQLLRSLAETAQLSDKIKALAAGAHLNVTEDRAVGHMALRNPKGSVSRKIRAVGPTSVLTFTRAALYRRPTSLTELTPFPQYMMF
jgi:glucose-6-phosphate isomerase